MSEIVTFVAKYTSEKSLGMNSWRTITVTSNEKFENSKLFHGLYVGQVSGDNLFNIPKNRDIEFTCAVKGKYLNCINWVCLKLRDLRQIEKFLYMKLNTELRNKEKKSLISQNDIILLVEKYGESTISLFENEETNKLMRYFNNDPMKVLYACKIINEMNTSDSFYRFMAEQGVNRTKAIKIWNAFGPDAENIVKSNPFICMEVEGIGFQTCDNIAIKLNVALDSSERIIAATKFTIDVLTSRTGDISAEIKKVCEATLKQLNMTGNNVTVEKWKNVIADEKKDKFSQFVYFNGEMMLRKDSDNELVTSKKICNMLKHNDEMNRKACAVADDINGGRTLKLSENQMKAVKRSLSSPVSIITGGPGTGKTTVVKTIVEAYKRTSRTPVTCMAPTGKASSRMSEATGEKAKTIHKTLNLIPGFDEENVTVLPEGLVIVDELSMIDQDTMAKMMKAMSTHGQIILVGDVDQLPSVGKGDVLNQLINSDVVPVSRLTETFRQKNGSLIIDNAYKVNHGKKDLIYDTETFQYIEMKDSDIEKFKKIYTDKVEQYGIENVMVLCPLRREKADKPLNFISDKLNSVLQNMINPYCEGKIESKIKTAEGKMTVFRIGDRIMQWKNKEDSSNGDIGVITNISKNNDDVIFEIKWEIDGTVSNYNISDMETITLAYAMSIHKSQGSEAKCVIMPFMSEHKCPIFQRNLLYTGITRAKQECIIVGDRSALNYCIDNCVTGTRKSYLAERLKRRINEN